MRTREAGLKERHGIGMGVTYTAEQQKVIDTRGCNLLVSAAAGSGKTAVLVERIVKMVSDAAYPVDIDRLLVVTFTNAAAAEMRERVSNAIGDKLAGEPENCRNRRRFCITRRLRRSTVSACLSSAIIFIPSVWIRDSALRTKES